MEGPREVIQEGASTNDEGLLCRSTVHITGFTGNLEVLKSCVSKDKKVLTRKDKQGRIVFHFAPAHGRSLILSYLLHLEMATRARSADDDGWMPLHWACRGRGDSVVQLLLDKGYDPSIRTLDDRSTIDIATMHKSWAVLALIRDRMGIAPVTDDEEEGATDSLEGSNKKVLMS